MAPHGSSKHGHKLPELSPPPSFHPQESHSEQSYGGYSHLDDTHYHSALVLRRRRSYLSEPSRPDSDFVPPPPAPKPQSKYKQIEYYHHASEEDEDFEMSGALATRATSGPVACRAPDRRIATLTASEELPPGIPAQVTFVAAHHCAGCGQPRSHAHHKDHPLIPGQVAPASLCRKCEKKIEKGQPIDSIVLPIRDFGSDNDKKERGRKKSRPRSASRTRVVVRYASEDRGYSPPSRPVRKPSPDPPKREIKFRHVDSRSLSRPAPKSEPKEVAKALPAPGFARRQSPPARHSKYVIEHIRHDRGYDDKTPAKSNASSLPTRTRRTSHYDDYYDRVAVDVREQRRRDPSPDPEPPKSRPQSTAPPPKKDKRDDIPPPPMGLPAMQPNKRSSVPPASVSDAGYPCSRNERIVYIRRSPSPPPSKKERSKQASSIASAPSATATSVSTIRPSIGPEPPQDARRSDYLRYQHYHTRPPSPPPPTSAAPSASKKSVAAPNTIEYIIGGRFKQNPNPGATKTFSEVSVADSRQPASRVTFTESEITAVNGVRVRDEHYRTRSTERVVIDADRGSRGDRSEQRRQERSRATSEEYAYIR